MSPKAFATILVRCIGLYLLVGGLGAVSSAFQVFGFSSDAEGVPEPRYIFIWSGLHALAILAVGIVFVFHTEPVARYIVRDIQGSGMPFDGESVFHAVGLSILGAWVLSSALPSLLSQLVVIVVLGDARRRPELVAWWGQNWSQFVFEVLQVILGLCLFAASTKLVRFWSRAQGRAA